MSDILHDCLPDRLGSADAGEVKLVLIRDAGSMFGDADCDYFTRETVISNISFTYQSA